MESLFDSVADPERDAFLRRVSALIAPVAANAGAVTDDPDVLPVARAIYEAFGTADASGGLSRAQLAVACSSVCDESTFTSRFDLFVRMGMLLPHFDKAHQQRYVFNPTSAAGLLVFERLADRGGVDELLTLLDRTRQALEAGTATRELVQSSLRNAQRMMTISADHLLRLVSSSPLSELVAERRHHSHESLIDEVRALNRQVHEAFPDLDPDAYRLVQEAQRYVGAREAFVSRLLDEGAATQDFSLLDPEEYLEAARTAGVDALAEVFGRVVFDPPEPWLDPDVVADIVTEFRPRAALRRRPPRPADPLVGDDPLQRVEQRAAASRLRRERAAELHLQGEDSVDLTSRMRAAGWPGAAAILVEVLAADADPDLPFAVQMTNELLIESDAPVTYLTPVSLHRQLRAPLGRSSSLAESESVDG